MALPFTWEGNAIVFFKAIKVSTKGSQGFTEKPSAYQRKAIDMLVKSRCHFNVKPISFQRKADAISVKSPTG